MRFGFIGMQPFGSFGVQVFYVTNDSSGSMTLGDVAKMHDETGAMNDIIDALEVANEFITRMTFIESNQINIHRMTRRTTLQKGAFYGVDQAVALSKTTRGQVDEPLALYKTKSGPDKSVAENAGLDKLSETIDEENRSALEGIARDLAYMYIYGARTTDPLSFDGFAWRRRAIGTYCLNAAGNDANNNTSIYVVQFGKMMINGLFPKGGQKQLIKMEYRGLTTITDLTTGNLRDIYLTDFEANLGLAEHRSECLIRIANIKTTDPIATSKADDFIIKALQLMPKRGDNAVVLMNRFMFGLFGIYAKDKTNIYWQPDQVGGAPVLRVHGKEILQTDAILNNEPIVT